jgi:hypothetical protein
LRVLVRNRLAATMFERAFSALLNTLDFLLPAHDTLGRYTEAVR